MKLLNERTTDADAHAEVKAEIISEIDVEAETEANEGKEFSGAAATQRITNSKLTKRTAASSSHKRTAPVEQQHVSRKRNADTGEDGHLSALTTKRVQVMRKLQSKEAAIRRLEWDLQDESRVPAWRVEQRSVGSWRAKRTASLQKAKQEYDEVLAELKVTDDVLVLYRAARRWYIDHGKSGEFFTKLRKDGYDRPEKIIRHFWKGVSHVDRNVLFELCVTESPFVFECGPYKLEAWREAFGLEEAFNDYFSCVFSEEASGWHRVKFCDPSVD